MKYVCSDMKVIIALPKNVLKMNSTVLLRHLPIYYEAKRYIPIHTLSQLLYIQMTDSIFKGAKKKSQVN